MEKLPYQHAVCIGWAVVLECLALLHILDMSKSNPKPLNPKPRNEGAWVLECIMRPGLLLNDLCISASYVDQEDEEEKVE